MTGEFDIIERIRRRAEARDDSVLLGIGDDAALLAVPEGLQLAVTTDTLNQGVHFTASDDPGAIGHKALAVSLSDLAAMGAQPRWAFLNLSLPTPDDAWVDAFTGGFLSLASSARVSLAGGDTTRGERSVTVTLLGVLAADLALTRSGARPGDRIVVSGCPGLAAWALQERLAGRVAARAAEDALDRPTPRLALGAALAGKATACIDVSDGLLADLAHVAKASGCGAELQLDALPGHAAFSGLADPQRWDLQLGGGDDYELCFCLPAENLGCLPDLAHRLGLCLSDIGEMTDGPELVCRSPDGRVYAPRRPGFVHFETPGGSS